MKLKLIKTPRPVQKDMVCLTSYGAFKWTSVGAVVEVSEEAGYEILNKWKACFEIVASTQSSTQSDEAPKKKKTTKMAASPANKMVGSDDKEESED
jgi:hypothetical protein